MEKWKDITGYEGLYQVSDQGRVRSLDRKVKSKGSGSYLRKGQLIKPKMRRDGYPSVGLRADGGRKFFLVHRLVLEAFVGVRPEGMEARHLNDVKSDARLENLVWGTRSENNYDRVRNKVDYYTKRACCKRGHELVDKNLVPNQLNTRGGVKTCLACARAHSTVKLHTDLRSRFQEVSDIHFENIVGEGKRMMRSDFLV
jgi:hypothetical protein